MVEMNAQWVLFQVFFSVSGYVFSLNFDGSDTINRTITAQHA